MSYLALARKYRPKTFSELVGQTHVVRALSNALDNDRLHHAFLFTGTRGVGKTTIARIFAKSINCESGVSSNPCGTCPTCREIDEGRFVDLIEIDAASKTKVEDTRDLLDNVQYAATRGRYKVYLIDEVHMLSGHSFNALLKTLEEPPEHVKFLLATTDPQKIPVTILSRCLQFNLRRLTVDQIAEHLTDVLHKENIEAELAAIKQLAKSADGSLRDALSLLDQAIAYSNSKLSLENIDDMLGTIKTDNIAGLLLAIAQNRSADALKYTNEIVNEAADIQAVYTHLIAVLHGLALYQQYPEAGQEVLSTLNIPGEQADELINALSAEDLQLSYQIVLNGQRDLMFVPDKKTALEMTVLRIMAFRPVDLSASRTDTKQNPQQQVTPASNTASNKKSQPASGILPAETEQNLAAEKPAPAMKQATEKNQASIKNKASMADIKSDWYLFVQSLGLAGIDKELAQSCAVRSASDKQVLLVTNPANAPLANKERIKKIQQAVSDLLDVTIKLDIEVTETDLESPREKDIRHEHEQMAAAKLAIEKDSNVQSLMNAFDANVNTESIKPVEN